MTRENNGFYVLLKSKEKKESYSHPIKNGVIDYSQWNIVGQSYAWLSQNGNLVFDSWENLRPTSDDPIITDMLPEFSKKIIQLKNNIGYILIGAGGKTPSTLVESECIINPEKIKEGSQYTDSEEQCIIAKDDEKIKKLGQEESLLLKKALEKHVNSKKLSERKANIIYEKIVRKNNFFLNALKLETPNTQKYAANFFEMDYAVKNIKVIYNIFFNSKKININSYKLQCIFQQRDYSVIVGLLSKNIPIQENINDILNIVVENDSTRETLEVFLGNNAIKEEFIRFFDYSFVNFALKILENVLNSLKQDQLLNEKTAQLIFKAINHKNKTLKHENTDIYNNCWDVHQNTWYYNGIKWYKEINSLTKSILTCHQAGILADDILTKIIETEDAFQVLNFVRNNISNFPSEKYSLLKELIVLLIEKDYCTPLSNEEDLRPLLLDIFKEPSANLIKNIQNIPKNYFYYFLSVLHKTNIKESDSKLLLAKFVKKSPPPHQLDKMAEKFKIIDTSSLENKLTIKAWMCKNPDIPADIFTVLEKNSISLDKNDGTNFFMMIKKIYNIFYKQKKEESFYDLYHNNQNLSYLLKGIKKELCFTIIQFIFNSKSFSKNFNLIKKDFHNDRQSFLTGIKLLFFHEIIQESISESDEIITKLKDFILSSSIICKIYYVEILDPLLKNKLVDSLCIIEVISTIQKMWPDHIDSFISVFPGIIKIIEKFENSIKKNITMKFLNYPDKLKNFKCIVSSSGLNIKSPLSQAEHFLFCLSLLNEEQHLVKNYIEVIQTLEKRNALNEKSISLIQFFSEKNNHFLGWEHFFEKIHSDFLINEAWLEFILIGLSYCKKVMYCFDSSSLSFSELLLSSLNDYYRQSNNAFNPKTLSEYLFDQIYTKKDPAEKDKPLATLVTLLEYSIVSA